MAEVYSEARDRNGWGMGEKVWGMEDAWLVPTIWEV